MNSTLPRIYVTKKIKNKSRDVILTEIQNKLMQTDCAILRSAISKDMAQIEKLFGYTPYSWARS